MLFVASAQAQHPVEVQKQAASGDYMAALATFKRMPSRVATTASAVAAAKSAWSLGLAEIAKEEFDHALNIASIKNDISDSEKARIIFSRGIVEFQDQNYQSSIVYAEKAVELVSEVGPLRSEINTLWAESLLKLNKQNLAELKLLEALNGVRAESKGDLHFLLATCQMQLGKLDQAKKNFESIPLRHLKGPIAIRGLANIAFETDKYEESIFWLNKGRQEFEDAFLDSWVDYALVKSYGELQDLDKLKETYDGAIGRYAPSDSWLILLQAIAEQYLWQSNSKSKNTTGE